MEFEKQIASAALQWAASARESFKTTIWAAMRVEGAKPFAPMVRKWVDVAESSAMKAQGKGLMAAAAAAEAAHAAAYAAEEAKVALVADQGPSFRARVRNRVRGEKGLEASLKMLELVAGAAAPTAKDSWCELFSPLDLGDGVEDEARRELIEHSRRASSYLAEVQLGEHTVSDVWKNTLSLFFRAAAVEEEWEAAAAELEEVKREIQVEDVVAFAKEIAKAAKEIEEEWWAQPVGHLFLEIRDGAPLAIAISTAVAMSGYLGAAVAAREGKSSDTVRVVGHAARRRALLWIAATAKAKRQ